MPPPESANITSRLPRRAGWTVLALALALVATTDLCRSGAALLIPGMGLFLSGWILATVHPGPPASASPRGMIEHLKRCLEQERKWNALRGNFTNTISHEFRTPLGIILVSAGMLRRFDSRFGPKEKEEQLDAIERAVKRINGLVDQSLDMGWAEMAAPQLREMNPMALCRRVVDEVQISTAHRCKIWLQAGGRFDRGFTDESMLRTILANLLGNAVKYSPAGSKVVLQLARKDRDCVFTVRDQGAGFKDEDVSRLFQHFQRGRETKGIPGTGLGLAIVKRCTEALGGAVEARNASDRGAEFAVQIPIFVQERELIHENNPGD